MKNPTVNNESLDLVWVIKDIAKFIGRTERQAFYMASEGKIPAKQVGGRWVASKQKLIEFFIGDVA